MISKKIFGTHPSGAAISSYTLELEQSLSVTILELGGIIQSILLKTHTGKREVTLGMSSLEDYISGHPYFGCITGRVAGRISSGKFTINNEKFSLEINDPPNHLHGGINALHKQLWQVLEASESTDGTPVLRLTHTSPHGACNYPGTVNILVTYTLLKPLTLAIEYEATTDKTTPLSLTNHAYFNLAGEDSGHILDHKLQILADHYIPADFEMTLTGRITPVEGSPADLRKPRPIAQILPALHRAHGDNYYFSAPKTQIPRHVATLVSPSEDLRMCVFTTEKNLQFYTGRFLADKAFRSRSGRFYQPFEGVCLECQGYPDGVNCPDVEDILLKPGQKYYQRTEYRFEIL